MGKLRAEDEDGVRPAERARAHPVERRHQPDAEIASQPTSFTGEAGPEHHDAARNLLRRVGDRADSIPARLHSARSGRGCAGATVSVQDEDDRARAGTLRGRWGRPLRARLRGRRCSRGERALLGGAFHLLGDEADELASSDREQEQQLDGRDRPCDVRRRPPRADEALVSDKRVIHGRSFSPALALLLPLRVNPVPGRAETVLELDHRLEPELVRCERRIEGTPLQLPETCRSVLGSDAGLGDLGAQGVEIHDARLAPGTDVVDAAVLAECRRGRASHVADVHVVARLQAVPEDVGLLASGEGTEEDRDHACLPVRVLARAVDIPVAERDVLRPVQTVVRGQVLLARELGRPVRGDRLTGRGLRGGNGALTVDRAARGAEHDLRVVAARTLEDADGADHVYLCVLGRPLDGDANVRLCGEVEDGLRPNLVEQVVERLPNIADVKPRARRDVLSLSLGERVDDRDLITASDERIDDVRTDEAGSAGHDRPHGCILRSVRSASSRLELTTDDGVRLVGTMTFPNTGDEVAAALLLNGSGPLDRDSNMRGQQLDVASSLADSLAARDVASFRFDKRGVGESDGDYLTTSFDRETEDAAAALLAVRDAVGIDPARVSVVGHSVGATIAIRLAARYEWIAGVVLLAAACVPGDEVMRIQSERMADSLRGLQRLAARRFLRRQNEIRRALQASEGDVLDVEGGLPARWFREYMAYEPALDLRAIRCPVLAITGRSDIQVEPDDVERIGDLVAGSFTGSTPDDLTHVLRKDSRRPSLATYPSQLRRPVDAELLETVSEWVSVRYTTAVGWSRCSSRSRGSTARESRRRRSSLRARLEADGLDVVSTREPGGTELGEGLRDLVLHGGHVGPWAEALIYVAARAQLVDDVIRPALERGASVICDRYLDSSVAYQGVARGLGLERMLELNLAAIGHVVPDRTFLLELEPSEVASRIQRHHDRLEREGDDFRERAAAGYRELAERFPDRIVVLDATLPPDVLAEEVYGALRIRA